MKNPLTTLDELLYRQFEGITEFTNRKLRLDSQDLTSITNKVLSLSSIGIGIFASMRGYVANQAYDIFLGGIISAFGGYLTYKSMQEPAKIRPEYHSENQGFSNFRPIILGASILLFFTGMGYFIYGVPKVPECFSKISPEKYSKGTGLMHLFTSIFAFSFASYNYFKDQKPTRK